MRGVQAGKLCATPFGVDVVGITEVLLFGGALAGGIVVSMALQCSAVGRRPSSLDVAAMWPRRVHAEGAASPSFH